MAWEENSCISLHMQLIAILSRIGVYMWQTISPHLRIIINQEYRQKYRQCMEARHADNQKLTKVLTSIHPLYPIPGICHEYKSWQGFYDLRYGCSIVLDFFACISSIIAAYRFSVSWILRLRAFAFLLQFAVTMLYILASSVKTETSLSTYFSSS